MLKKPFGGHANPSPTPFVQEGLIYITDLRSNVALKLPNS